MAIDAGSTATDPDAAADQAAPLDTLLIDAALGPVRRFVPDASTARFAAGAPRRPRGAVRGGARPPPADDGTAARRAGWRAGPRRHRHLDRRALAPGPALR